MPPKADSEKKPAKKAKEKKAKPVKEKKAKPVKEKKAKPVKEKKAKPLKEKKAKPLKEKKAKPVKEKPPKTAKCPKKKQSKKAVIRSSSENEDSTITTETTPSTTTTIEKVLPLRYKCPVAGCNQSFKLTATLQQHYRCHSTDRKPFKCGLPACGKVYARQVDLYRHICNVENHDLLTKALDKEDAKRYVIVLSDVLDREYTALGIKKYCKGDVYGGADGQSLNAEQEDEKPANGQFPEGNGSTAQPPIMPYFTTIRQTASGQFECPFWKCTHLSKDRFTLKQHYRVHCGREYRPYLCAFNRAHCRYASNQKSAVEMHIRVAHFGLPAAKRKKKTTTILGGSGSAAGKKKSKQTVSATAMAAGHHLQATFMGTICLNSNGTEIATEEREEVEEERPLMVLIEGGEGEDDKKITSLEVDVGRYVQTVTEWLKMEDELFDRARLISELPAGGGAGGKVADRPRPFVCPKSTSTGTCTYSATSKTGLQRHLAAVHRPPAEVVELE